MSIKVMSWVFENGPSDPGERLVLLALADYAADNGEWSPSMVGIAAKAGMTERGARGVVRRLEAAGWIEVQIGGGRGGKSRYRITMSKPANPEQETRNDKPGISNPECGDTKPGMPRQKTRNEGSAEPSRTIKEPSEDKRAVAAALEVCASPKAVASFLAYRRKTKGGALTLTAAERLAEGLRVILGAGYDPDDALGMAEERGWQTVKPDWYFKEKGKQDGNRSAASQGGKRADPALEQIARLAGLGQASGDGRGGTGGSGEEAGPLWMGTRPQ